MAADEVILNQPRGAFNVRIVSPPKGTKVQPGKTRARAEVVVPDGRRIQTRGVPGQRPAGRLADQAALGDRGRRAATTSSSTSPWWPTLDDGTRAEAVRYLRAPQYVSEVDVNLVELYVAVTDRSGNLVSDLQAGRLRGLRGGQEAGDRQVRAGAEPAAHRRHPDRHLGLDGRLAGRDGEGGGRLPGERDDAAGQGLRRELRPPARSLRHAAHRRRRRRGAGASRALQAVGDTALHDALVHSLYYFRGIQGQRALVLLSDGDDNASYITYKDALEYASRSGVAIYAIGLNLPIFEAGVRPSSTSSPRRPAAGPSSPATPRSCRASTSRSRRELRSRYLVAYNSTERGQPDRLPPGRDEGEEGGASRRGRRAGTTREAPSLPRPLSPRGREGRKKTRRKLQRRRLLFPSSPSGRGGVGEVRGPAERIPFRITGPVGSASSLPPPRPPHPRPTRRGPRSHPLARAAAGVLPGRSGSAALAGAARRDAGARRGRARAPIREFLGRDPIPATGENELAEGIERRRVSPWCELPSPRRRSGPAPLPPRPARRSGWWWIAPPPSSRWRSGPIRERTASAGAHPLSALDRRALPPLAADRLQARPLYQRDGVLAPAVGHPAPSRPPAHRPLLLSRLQRRGPRHRRGRPGSARTSLRRCPTRPSPPATGRPSRPRPPLGAPGKPDRAAVAARRPRLLGRAPRRRRRCRPSRSPRGRRAWIWTSPPPGPAPPRPRPDHPAVRRRHGDDGSQGPVARASHRRRRAGARGERLRGFPDALPAPGAGRGSSRRPAARAAAPSRAELRDAAQGARRDERRRDLCSPAASASPNGPPRASRPS